MPIHHPRRAALLRALAAAAIMGLALALATWLGGLVGISATPDQPLGARLAVAGAGCVAVVAAIVQLRRRVDRAPLAGIGLTGPRSDAGGFLLGVGVVGASGALVIATLTLLGWAEWTGVDGLAVVSFLVTNTLVALLLEAIPEEIAIRGYALSSLRTAFPRAAATALGIAAFLLVPPFALAAGWALGLISGGEAFTLAPGGQDPVVYYTMLAAFGLLLTFARDATLAATVWTCIGAHLTWLTINRIVLGSAPGVDLAFAPDAELLCFAVYTSVAVIVFSLLAQRVAASRQQEQRSDQECRSGGEDHRY